MNLPEGDEKIDATATNKKETDSIRNQSLLANTILTHIAKQSLSIVPDTLVNSDVVKK